MRLLMALNPELELRADVHALLRVSSGCRTCLIARGAARSAGDSLRRAPRSRRAQALVDVQVQALFQARKFDHSILRAIIVMAAPSQVSRSRGCADRASV